MSPTRVDPIAEATAGDGARGDPIDGRLLQDRRPQFRKASGKRTGEHTRAAGDIEQPLAAREIDVLRERRCGQQAATVHRRGELLGEGLGLHRAMPVGFVGPAGEAGRCAAAQDLDQVAGNRPIGDLG